MLIIKHMFYYNIKFLLCQTSREAAEIALKTAKSQAIKR